MLLAEKPVSLFYDAHGNSLVYKDEISHPDKVFGTKRSKPLKLGNIGDIQLEDPQNPDSGLVSYIRLNWGPNNTPVYVFDDHNHALYGWFEAFKEGRIRFGAFLLHIDTHSDTKDAEGRLHLARSLDEAANYAKRLEIGEFIDPAERSGLVGDYRWVYRKAGKFTASTLGAEYAYNFSHYYHHIEHVATHLAKKIYDPRDLIVNIDADYFQEEPSENDPRAIDVMRDAMRKAGVVTIATSPGWIPAQRALSIVQTLLI